MNPGAFPGIAHVGMAPHIPNLPVLGWPWLLAALTCTGIYALRRRAIP